MKILNNNHIVSIKYVVINQAISLYFPHSLATIQNSAESSCFYIGVFFLLMFGFTHTNTRAHMSANKMLYCSTSHANYSSNNNSNTTRAHYECSVFVFNFLNACKVNGSKCTYSTIDHPLSHPCQTYKFPSFRHSAIAC